MLSQGKKMDQELHSRFFAEAGCGETESRLQGMHGFQAATERLLQIAIHNGNLVAILWIDLLNLRREFSLWGSRGVEGLVRNVSSCLRSAAEEDTLLGRFGARCFLAVLPASKFDREDRARIRCASAGSKLNSSLRADTAHLAKTPRRRSLIVRA